MRAKLSAPHLIAPHRQVHGTVAGEHDHRRQGPIAVAPGVEQIQGRAVRQAVVEHDEVGLFRFHGGLGGDAISRFEDFEGPRFEEGTQGEADGGVVVHHQKAPSHGVSSRCGIRCTGRATWARQPPLGAW